MRAMLIEYLFTLKINKCFKGWQICLLKSNSVSQNTIVNPISILSIQVNVTLGVIIK